MMKKEELQQLIDKKDKTTEELRIIGESYLKGDVLKDPVAAEGWLMKAVETEEEPEALIAMAIIAREILGKEEVLSDEDYTMMKGEVEMATGDEKKKLKILLSFATERQKML